LIKGDIGDSCEDPSNVVDGVMTLGDSVILTPVDFDASGDLNRFVGAAFDLGTLCFTDNEIPSPSLSCIDNIDFLKQRTYDECKAKADLFANRSKWAKR
jgi:hypothetical protein